MGLSEGAFSLSNRLSPGLFIQILPVVLDDWIFVYMQQNSFSLWGIDLGPFSLLNLLGMPIILINHYKMCVLSFLGILMNFQ